MHRFAAALFLSALIGPALAATEVAAPAPPPAAATPAAGTSAEAAPAKPDVTEPTEDPTAQVYLLTRIKLNGTDLTQVVFFRHNAMNTMEACETERNAGMTTGWNYFSRYYLKTLKGVSYKVDYRCVEGDQNMSVWRKGVPQDKFYLVRSTDNKLKVQTYKNFFACRDALRSATKEENIDVFCALSSQDIRKPATTAANDKPAAP